MGTFKPQCFSLANALECSKRHHVFMMQHSNSLCVMNVGLE